MSGNGVFKTEVDVGEEPVAPDHMVPSNVAVSKRDEDYGEDPDEEEKQEVQIYDVTLAVLPNDFDSAYSALPGKDKLGIVKS